MDPVGCVFAAAALNVSVGPTWWQNWWEPCAQCAHRIRVGNQGDGGKWMCKDANLTRVVSVGSNNQFDYELGMHSRFKSTVDVYDHTSDPPKERLSWLTYHKLPMTAGRMDLVAARKPNVLKIDCEGCEYDVFNRHNLAAFKAAGTQIAIEVHYRNGMTAKLWQLFENAGYYAAHKEPNIQFGGGMCVELLLVPWKIEAPRSKAIASNDLAH